MAVNYVNMNYTFLGWRFSLMSNIWKRFHERLCREGVDACFHWNFSSGLLRSDSRRSHVHLTSKCICLSLFIVNYCNLYECCSFLKLHFRHLRPGICKNIPRAKQITKKQQNITFSFQKTFCAIASEQILTDDSW